MKKIKLSNIVLPLFIALALTSCQNSASEAHDGIIYNSSIYNEFVDDSKYIYGNIINKTKVLTIIQDKSTGKTEWFIRDPFYKDMEDSSYVRQIQIDDENNKGYYMDISIDDEDAGFSIIQFDLKTFNKKEIYRESFMWHKPVFLGLSEVSDIKVSRKNDFNKEVIPDLGSDKKPKYFVDNNNLYLIRENGIFKINIKNNKQTELIKEDNIKSVSYDGSYIYYINDIYELYKYSVKTGEKVKLTSNKSTYSIITEDKIIYTNLNDGNRIYIINKDGTDDHRIGDSKAKSLNYDDEYIYYSNEDDKQCLYRLKYDGSENTKMTDRPAYFVFTFKNYDKVYILSDNDNIETGYIFSVDKEDFTIKLQDFKIY